MEGKDVLTIAVGLQTTAAITAIILNLILLYLILRHTKCNMGFYKYLLAGYALFEALFAFVVLIGMPIHFVSDKAWMVFSFCGVLGGTKAIYLGPTIFCWFYEVWLGYSIVNFTYRYLAVCRQLWVDRIKRSLSLKLLIILVILIFCSLCGICAFALCTAPVINPKVQEKLRHTYGINPSQISHVIIRFYDNDGMPEVAGILGASTHYILIVTSTIAVFYFSYVIWRGIRRLQHQKAEVDIKLEKQLFKVLMIQTIVPLIMSHIPSLVNLSFPFWSDDVNLASLTPFFSVFTTFQKSIDPVVAMIYIGDYKRAIRRVFRRNNSIEDTGSTFRNSGPVPTVTNQGQQSFAVHNVI